MRVIYKHGEIYEGQSKKDLREGYGRFIRADGSYYLGTVQYGRRHGIGTEYRADGSVEQHGSWEFGYFNQKVK